MSETNGQTNGAIKKPAKTPAGYTLHKPNGDFALGNPGGPGYPKGRKRRDFFAELLCDLQDVERKQRKSFLRHRWERAFEKDEVAADMMSYLMPKPKPADISDPPELTFHAPAQVTVINHAQMTFGNGA